MPQRSEGRPQGRPFAFVIFSILFVLGRVAGIPPYIKRIITIPHAPAEPSGSYRNISFFFLQENPFPCNENSPYFTKLYKHKAGIGSFPEGYWPVNAAVLQML